MTAARELEQIGKKILNASRTELYLSMPFFGVALDSLFYVMDRSIRTIGTDAVSIRFQPAWLMQEYLSHPYRINRAYIHMLLHCIFRHMFSAVEHEDNELWDLSCDIAVESMLDSFDYPAITVVPSDFREEWYERIKSEVRVLAAEKIYQYFLGLKEDYELRMRLMREFTVDDHGFWKRMEADHETGGPGGMSDGQTSDRNESTSGQNADGKGNPPDEPNGKSDQYPDGKNQDSFSQNADTDQKPFLDQEQENDRQTSADALPMGSMKQKDEEWRKHAKRIKSELETYAKEKSEDAGSLTWMLRFTYDKRRDYRDFLKKFAVVREEAAIDPDSFDYGYYNYGLTYYGNMPLIEENEFREAKKIETLVIAIDTSASCKDVLVQKFLNETASILIRQENFFHRVQILLIECDNRIQNEIWLTDLSQMKQFADGFCMKGGYGTDFRPVFARVEALKKSGELKDLKGLLYFTDGFGDFPVHPTSYETAFVFFSEEENNAKDVPDWAVRLFVTDEDTD